MVADFASSEAGKLGGKARAEKLSKSKRQEIAKKAAAARWGERVPIATHGSPDHPLKIGETEIQCYVLDDGTRVLTQADLQEALGKHRKANVRNEGGEERLPAILQGKSINPFIDKDLIEKSRPIKFRTPHGSIASGYRAELLPAVCDVYLKAREANALPKNLAHVARQAEILMRGLAHVGIIALVDEATGYQYDRARHALEQILEAFIKDELGKWAKRFPDEFYRELFRLKGLEWPTDKNPPQYVGHWTNDLVYKRLAPGILKELREITPKTRRGHRLYRFHQWLTDDVGHPKLQEHLSAVIALMKATDDWDTFKKMLDRSLPRHKDLPLFDNIENGG